MKRYLVLIKSSFMHILVYRANSYFDLILNIFFIFLLYYFWKAVYFNSDQINGMTFHQTFVYIVFASLIAASINTLVEVRLADRIFRREIVYDLVRPLDFQLRMFFESIGGLILRLLIFTIPILTVFLLVFNTEIQLGRNIPFFFMALMFSFVINYLIGFTAGMLGLYTQSAWGISAFKNFMVSLFSGALIPLNFYPEFLKKITFLLPFHTIINTPMMLLTAKDLSGAVAFNYLFQQAIWVGALLFISILLFRLLINKLIVNGG